MCYCFVGVLTGNSHGVTAGGGGSSDSGLESHIARSVIELHGGKLGECVCVYVWCV